MLNYFQNIKSILNQWWGGGSVYFAKEPAPKEVISDADKDLMRFYRALKKGNVTRCDITPNREKFNAIVKRGKKHPLSPCEYLYRNKLSYGAKHETYNLVAIEAHCGDKQRTCGVKSKNKEKYMNRLKKTTLTEGDFRNTCKKYDGKETLHYLDPPYPETTGVSSGGYKFGKGLLPSEVKQLSDSLKGMVVISYNDIPLVKKEFCHDQKYKCRKIKHEYTLNRGKHQPITELIITKGI